VVEHSVIHRGCVGSYPNGSRSFFLSHAQVGNSIGALACLMTSAALPEDKASGQTGECAAAPYRVMCFLQRAGLSCSRGRCVWQGIAAPCCSYHADARVHVHLAALVPSTTGSPRRSRSY
jgi:hypothetical protein